jgi:hypothetical protein
MTKQVLRSLAYEAFKDYHLWKDIDVKIAWNYYVLFTRYTEAFIS